MSSLDLIFPLTELQTVIWSDCNCGYSGQLAGFFISKSKMITE